MREEVPLLSNHVKQRPCGFFSPGRNCAWQDPVCRQGAALRTRATQLRSKAKC